MNYTARVIEMQAEIKCLAISFSSRDEREIEEPSKAMVPCSDHKYEVLQKVKS